MFSVLLRAVILYAFVTVGIRLMGKRQIGEMQPGELAITLMISEAAAIPLQDINQPVILGIIAIFSLVFLEIGSSVLALKFPMLNRLVSGSPRIVIRDGAIDQKELRKLRITVSDLLELLRDRDVYDIATVAFAIIETNGGLNVLLKSENQPAEKKDVLKTFEKAELWLSVVNDGKIMTDAARQLGVSKKDIKKILEENKITVEKTFLLLMDKNRNYRVVRKEN